MAACAPEAETETLRLRRAPRLANAKGEPLLMDAVAAADSGEVPASARRLYRLDRENQQWVRGAEDALPARANRIHGAVGGRMLVNGDSSGRFHSRLARWSGGQR